MHTIQADFDHGWDQLSKAAATVHHNLQVVIVAEVYEPLEVG
jgi:hypothetical protein